MQVKDKAGKDIYGQQSEMDFLALSPDDSLRPEIVSAKLNGGAVRPGRDLENLADFYKLNTSNGSEALQESLRSTFESSAFKEGESVVVRYTDIATGKPKEIPLDEFRTRFPEPLNPETGKYDVKVLGLSPDDAPPKQGIEHIKLGIDQQPLLNKVTTTVDRELGDR
jgi:hypothetical protein